jgi:hypothetical protein
MSPGTQNQQAMGKKWFPATEELWKQLPVVAHKQSAPKKVTKKQEMQRSAIHSDM